MWVSVTISFMVAMAPTFEITDEDYISRATDAADVTTQKDSVFELFKFWKVVSPAQLVVRNHELGIYGI